MVHLNLSEVNLIFTHLTFEASQHFEDITADAVVSLPCQLSNSRLGMVGVAVALMFTIWFIVLDLLSARSGCTFMICLRVGRAPKNSDLSPGTR